MVKDLELSNPRKRFYLNNHDELIAKLFDRRGGSKCNFNRCHLCFTDLIEKQQFKLQQTIIMETGGMKDEERNDSGELHDQLCEGFGVAAIHSEYGMTVTAGLLLRKWRI
jgi:hypothetical protein